MQPARAGGSLPHRHLPRLLRPTSTFGASTSSRHGVYVPKPNYHHAKKQKELARKARKQEKEQRKSARLNSPEETAAAAAAPAEAGENTATAVETTSGTQS